MRYRRERKPHKDNKHLRSQTYRPKAAKLAGGISISSPDDFVLADCHGCPSLFEACMCMFHYCNHQGGIFSIDGYYGDQIVAGFIVHFDEGNITRVTRFDVTAKGGE